MCINTNLSKLQRNDTTDDSYYLGLDTVHKKWREVRIHW
jgi:hypothetical protein